MKSNLDITALAHGGHGIGRVDGQVCFVPYALPGDVVRVGNLRRSRGVLWADLDEILRPSPDRIDPGCPVYGTCGACTWLHFAYPAQAEWKQRIVRDCLERMARVQVDVGWAADPDLRLRSRTRAEFHGDGERLGFYEAASHDVVDIAACPLCHPRLNSALAKLRGRGMRGSVELVVNPEGDDVLVWTRGPSAIALEIFPHAQWPQDGAERAGFVFDGVPVVNGAFCQSSLLLNRVLVREVREAAGAPANLLDLYCGNGNLSLALAADCKVTGIDHNRAAVDAAQRTGTGRYRVGNEAGFRTAIRTGSHDVILLDPPRTGAKAIAADLAECGASRLVYVSCDPATLARDVKVITGGGWNVTRAVAVDLFPNTPHIETVCVLER